MLVIAAAALAMPAPALRAQAGTAESPDDVFVEVSWSGYNVRLGADGWIGFVSGEPRADLMSATVDPELAFATIDSLLGTGFLWARDEYPSSKERLWVALDGTISVGGSQVVDGGQVRIRLKVGSQDKTVRIDLPASPATGALMEWFRKFEELAGSALFGG